MNLKKGAIIGVSAFALYKIIGATSLIKDFVTNIITQPLSTRIHRVSGSLLNPVVQVVMSVRLYNYSGYTLTLNQLFSKLETNNGGKDYSVLGVSDSSIKSITIEQGKYKDIDIVMNITGITSLLASNFNSNKFRFLTTYTFKGIQQTTINAEFNAKEIIPLDKIKNALKSNVFSGLGYGNETCTPYAYNAPQTDYTQGNRAITDSNLSLPYNKSVKPSFVAE